MVLLLFSKSFKLLEPSFMCYLYGSLSTVSMPDGNLFLQSDLQHDIL